MTLRVCTFNLRTDAAVDGVNAFSGRTPLIAREFPKYEADVVGFQEVKPHMRDWLETNLAGYTVAGTGRGADLRDEHCVIAYRSDRFLLASLDTFWLSDTPRVPGSRFHTDQSGCPRICTAAVLLTREARRPLRVYNTHLDHVGRLAQAQGMTLILSRIAADEAVWPGAPVVLTGDMNALPDSPVIASAAAFTAGGRPLIDITAGVGPTYHGYHPEKTHAKIDYIFTSAVSDPARSRTLRDEENGVYFSDHYPVLGEIEL